ncbi:type II secretion system protein [Vibrio harveyi]|uniref:type II secretion system protein n=1 Tax=Vibrio harveyi TaxID=669 RepID=UPI0023806EB9|nr:type II secretion system protein [Vibrio harveyi]
MKNKGFTLIEMVVVIVLLGILAVTAAPRFLNLQDDARDATLEGYAGALLASIGIIAGKHKIEGEPDTLVVDGTELSFFTTEDGNTQSFEYPTATDVEQCMDIWNTAVNGIRAKGADAKKGELKTTFDRNEATCSYADLQHGAVTYKSGTGDVRVDS